MTDGLSRRRFVGLLAGVGVTGAVVGGGVAYTVGGNDHTAAPTPTPTPTPATPAATVTPSAAVNAVKPLAGAFYERVASQFDDVRVFVSQDAEVVMRYTSSATDGDALRAEFHQIAVAYARAVRETVGASEAVSLTLVVGPARAIVTGAAAGAFARGDLQRDAYLETIEVVNSERRTTQQ